MMSLFSHKHFTKTQNSSVCSVDNSALGFRKLGIKVYPNANKLSFTFLAPASCFPVAVPANWIFLALCYCLFSLLVCYLLGASRICLLLGLGHRVPTGQKGCSTVQHPWNLLTWLSAPEETNWKAQNYQQHLLPCPHAHHMTNMQVLLSTLPVLTFKSIHMIKGVKLHRLSWEPCLMMRSSLSAQVFALIRLYVLERNLYHKLDRISIRIAWAIHIKAMAETWEIAS